MKIDLLPSPAKKLWNSKRGRKFSFKKISRAKFAHWITLFVKARDGNFCTLNLNISTFWCWWEQIHSVFFKSSGLNHLFFLNPTYTRFIYKNEQYFLQTHLGISTKQNFYLITNYKPYSKVPNIIFGFFPHPVFGHVISYFPPYSFIWPRGISIPKGDRDTSKIPLIWPYSLCFSTLHLYLAPFFMKFT